MAIVPVLWWGHLGVLDRGEVIGRGRGSAAREIEARQAPARW